jgi:hypothetical protein
MRTVTATAAAVILLLLTQGGCIRLEGVDDADNFSIVGKAFDTIGMSKELQDQVCTHYILCIHCCTMHAETVLS